MGMLVNGRWEADADRRMVDGAFRREASALPAAIDDAVIARLAARPAEFVLVASASCPWSHGAVITAVLRGLGERLPVQRAGGPRIEGYGLKPAGPLTAGTDLRHAHQLYTRTDPAYTGRATVPLLWDVPAARILSNASGSIIAALDRAAPGPRLRPDHLGDDIDSLTSTIFDGLSNAVYRAGLAERQDEYDAAVDTVFATMEALDARLTHQRFLFGEALTTADVRLFATLVRFDTVYATHFRCTRRRLVDYPALWRFTRRLYQHPGVRETVDFAEIRRGYYLNDGRHNPFGILAAQPIIDWDRAP
ncbi:MAG: glutathione S-transferase C-terminal domain-containing protein [Pseudomonadota bacterium]